MSTETTILLLLTKMAVKCGKRQIEETDELSFLASAIKEGRRSRRRLQMQLAQPKTICEFGLPSIIAYSQIIITRLIIQFVPVVRFSKIHIFSPFPSKPLLAVRHGTAYFPTPFTLIVFKFLCTSNKFITCSRKQAVCAWQKWGTYRTLGQN